MGIKGRALEPHVETLGAAFAFLWLPLKAFDAGKPV
jgi:hypothetical protein